MVFVRVFGVCQSECAPAACVLSCCPQTLEVPSQLQLAEQHGLLLQGICTGA